MLWQSKDGVELMRKVFVLALVLMMALVGMSIAAAENFDALTGNYYAVRFANGYTGFCIDNLLEVATANKDKFVESLAANAKSNLPLYTEEHARASDNLKEFFYGQDKDDSSYGEIDQYLKAAIVHHHDKLFAKNGNGSYYDAMLSGVPSTKTTNMGFLFWVFSDSRFRKIPADLSIDDPEDYQYFVYITGYEPTETMASVVLDAIERVDVKKESIPDHYRCTLADGTEAEFDFLVMDSVDDTIQDYFCFKITYYRDMQVEAEEELVMDASIPASQVVSYQWAEETDGEFEPMGNTAATLKLDASDVNDGKRYRCTITGKNYVSNMVFTVDVIGAEPEVITPTIDWSEGLITQTGEGGTVTLTVEAENADKYNWYKETDGGEYEQIASGTSKTLTTGTLEYADNGKKYYCEAVNTTYNTKAATEPLSITVNKKGSLPKIISPDDKMKVSFLAGEKLTLSVTAENADTYQWFVDKGNGEYEVIEGAEESSYTIEKTAADQNGWKYICCASNEFGDDFSPEFVLNIEAMPKLPSTGDSSAMTLWMVLLFGAASVLASMFAVKRSLSR